MAEDNPSAAEPTPPRPANAFLAGLREHRVYRVALGYAVGAWIILQVSAIVLPGFAAPPWVLRTLMILLALGFGAALLAGWGYDRRVAGKPLLPRARRGWLGWALTALLPAAVVSTFFLLRPLPRPAAIQSAVAVVTPAAAVPAVPAVPEKSIAVLPFDNLSDDKQNAYFADGVQDEILTDLAKIADLKVISRTSTRQYRSDAPRNLPEIAQALKVAHVLEGSVQRSGGRVRVTAQLIDARTDAHLWAQRFDGDLADVFAIQSEIAQKIADQLQAVLSPKERAAITAKPTKDLVAYDLYLHAKQIEQGNAAVSPQVTRDEIRLLEEATARDPAFVPALCALAQAHLTMYWFNLDHTEARLAQAKQAIDAAERLQPDAGEVHLSKALLRYHVSRDYAAALAELRLARTSLPNDTKVFYITGAVERRQGLWEESTRHFTEALRLDPQNATSITELAGNYVAARRYAEPTRLLDEALRWSPNNFYFQLLRAELDRDSRADLRRAKAFLSSEAARTADPDDVAEIRLAVALETRDFAAAEKTLADYKAPDFANGGYITPREVREGLVALGLGDQAKAQTAFHVARDRTAARLAKRPDDPKALIALARIDAYLGQRDEAIREGERAVALLPVEKDALDGPQILTSLAGIYAQAGQPDRALDVLKRVVTMNWGPSYGDLKLDQDWDPLRGNPRFVALVTSLTPNP